MPVLSTFRNKFIQLFDIVNLKCSTECDKYFCIEILLTLIQTSLTLRYVLRDSYSREAVNLLDSHRVIFIKLKRNDHHAYVHHAGCLRYDTTGSRNVKEI